MLLGRVPSYALVVLQPPASWPHPATTWWRGGCHDDYYFGAATTTIQHRVTATTTTVRCRRARAVIVHAVKAANKRAAPSCWSRALSEADAAAAWWGGGERRPRNLPSRARAT